MTDEKTPRTDIVKFSDFADATGEGIEGVGLKNGQNVRFALTTDAVAVNPNTFRNDKGQFIGTPDELADLKNQRDVNEFFYNAINDIEAGDVNLDGYVTDEQLAQVNEASEFRDDALSQRIDDESAENTAAHLVLTQLTEKNLERIEANYTRIKNNEARIDVLESHHADPVSEGTLKWVDYTYTSDTIDALVSTIRVHTDRTKMSLNWDTLDDGRKDWENLINDSVGLEVDGTMYWAIVEYVGEAGQSGRGKNFNILEHNIPPAGEIAENTVTGIYPNFEPSELRDYLPLSGGEMEPSAQIKVNSIAPVNTTSIKYDGSPSGHPMSLMNRGMISDFIDEKTDGLASEEYVDNADYLKLTGGTLTGTLNAPRVEAQKLEGGEAMMLIEGKLANNNSAARLTFSNKTNANAYGSLTWHGQNSDGWFAFNKDLDMNSEGLHSVGRIRLTGEKVICEGNLNRILLDNKVVITKVSGNGAGFTVKGKTNGGSNADLLYVYHNSTGLDAVNYAGKQDAASNIATVGYVDNAVSAIPAPTVGRRFKYGDGNEPADGYFSINGADILFSFVDLDGLTRKMTSGPDFGWTNFGRMTVWNAEGELWYAAELTRSTNYSTTMMRLYKESVKLDRTLVVDEEYSITIEGYW